ncbi:DUF4129 domain-containing protein [Halobacteriales archaeon Cl-PHB]
MDGDAVAALLVGLACVAGIGMAAGTLQSAVETTPDDAIDIDASAVPLGSGEIQDYKDRLQGKGTPAADGGQASATEKQAQAGDDTKQQAGQQQAGSADTGKQDSGAATGGRSDESGQGAGDGVQSLLDKLLALLRALLSLLLSLVPFALGLAALALAVVYRDRLLAAYRDRFGGDGHQPATTSRSVRHAAPSNEVARAWHEMVSLVGVDDRETKTPRECADRAVDRGVDPEAVESVTEPFEEVTYGGAPASADRTDRARQGLRQVRTDLGDGR